MDRVFVFGAGGHGKVVMDALMAAGVPALAGFIDDNEKRQGACVLGLPVLGNSEWLKREASRSKIGVALGIGNNQVRHLVAEQCARWGAELITVIHPKAAVAASAWVGAGTVVMANAAINAEARVGAGAIVNTGAVVEHDNVVGDYAHLSPNAAMGGEAHLGALSHLGIGAVILPGVRVGCRSVVGAGAVVVRDLPDEVIAIGVPARVHRSIRDE